MDRLREKVAIITGGASGMGRASSLLFSAEGASVVVVDRNEAMGKETIELIEDQKGRCLFINADISKPEGIDNIVSTAVREFGKIDILFGNAGVDVFKSTLQTEASDWEYLFGTNLKGHFFLTKAVAPHMIKNHRGAILFTSSTSAISGEDDQVAYSATKGGIISMVTAMAKEFGPHNIRVNCILPGTVDTPLFRKWVASKPNAEKTLAEAVDSALIKRLGTPEDIAYAALFLVSDESSWITGSAYRVDGGYLVRH
jgi:NAD(P)-dependent dehydrogenase (short-subunit alcohol dehydrogenase family)